MSNISKEIYSDKGKHLFLKGVIGVISEWKKLTHFYLSFSTHGNLQKIKVDAQASFLFFCIINFATINKLRISYGYIDRVPYFFIFY